MHYGVTTFYMIHYDLDHIPRHINNKFIKSHDENYAMIQLWCSANKLHINSSKTVILKFSNKNINFSNSFLNFNENQISLSYKFVLLGVIVDENLDFKFHIEAVVAKLARTTGIIYKIKNSVPSG